MNFANCFFIKIIQVLNINNWLMQVAMVKKQKNTANLNFKLISLYLFYRILKFTLFFGYKQNKTSQENLNFETY